MIQIDVHTCTCTFLLPSSLLHLLFHFFLPLSIFLIILPIVLSPSFFPVFASLTLPPFLPPISSSLYVTHSYETALRLQQEEYGYERRQQPQALAPAAGGLPTPEQRLMTE